MRRAIESKDCCELEIYYKPIINIVSRKIVAAESFVTWNSPELGTVYPLELIPLAESTDLIIELGDWLLQNICIQNKIWSDSGFFKLPISINLSTSQFQHPDLVLKISKALAENYLEQNQIQIEINETTIAKNINSAIAIINNLKSVGVQIAIDDFGTGNSSLIYLKKLPVHTLKIDSYFIHNLTNDKQKSAITNALIQMAYNLDIEVIAQGVESETELIFLKNQNCNLMQGSLFGSLLSTADLERAILVPDC